MLKMCPIYLTLCQTNQCKTWIEKFERNVHHIIHIPYNYLLQFLSDVFLRACVRCDALGCIHWLAFWLLTSNHEDKISNKNEFAM